MRALLDKLTHLAAAEEASAASSSAATPAAYEEAGREHLLSIIEDTFGLRVPENVRSHRLQGEADFSSEWDFRVPVMCSGVPRNHRASEDFIIYPTHDAYTRPARPSRARQLTPTKIPGSPGGTYSDFMAIFEITTEEEWSKKLCLRMETRLAVSLGRARELQPRDEAPLGICDVVAVIGVVGVASCQRSVPSQVKTPLLREMMDAARFVFVRLPYSGSPKAAKALVAAAGGGAAGGAAGGSRA
jgi:hypothetical protein